MNDNDSMAYCYHMQQNAREQADKFLFAKKYFIRQAKLHDLTTEQAENAFNLFCILNAGNGRIFSEGWDPGKVNKALYTYNEDTDLYERQNPGRMWQ